MKNSSLVLVGVLALVSQVILFSCGKTDPAPSDSCWSTVDDYQMLTGKGSEVEGIAIDATNNVLVVGQTRKATDSSTTMIRRSTDGGATWTVIDPAVDTGGSTSNPFALFYDKVTGVFHLAAERYVTSSLHWHPYKSTDGTTWSTALEDYQLSGGQNSSAKGIVTDASGNIYVGGAAADATADHWVIRKGTSAGTGWATVNDYQLVAGKDAEVNSLTKDAAGVLYAMGHAADATNGHWIVRKSADGATWTTIDDYQLIAGQYAMAAFLVSPAAGTLIVSGGAADAGGKMHAIIRKSTDSGATWTTVDNQQGATDKDDLNIAIGAASATTIYTAGFTQSDFISTDGKPTVGNWVVRKSTDGGATWAVNDTYQLASSKAAYGYSMSIDSNGKVYVGGTANDATGVKHWIVRKCN